MQLNIVAFSTLLAFGLAATPWVPEAGTSMSWWQSAHDKNVQNTQAHKADIQVIFEGDSITAGWTDTGSSIWQQNYASRHAYNYAIPGVRTENVIWQIQNKEFDGVTAKLIVLMIGTNNIGVNTNEDIAKGVKEIINQFQTKMPSAKILLLGILPRNGASTDNMVKAVNTLISAFADNQKVFYLDMNSNFETAPGVQIADLYNSDKLHLTQKGYQTWHNAMYATFNKTLG